MGFPPGTLSGSNGHYNRIRPKTPAVIPYILKLTDCIRRSAITLKSRGL